MTGHQERRVVQKRRRGERLRLVLEKVKRREEKMSTLTLREYNNVRGEKTSTMISEKRRGVH